MPILVVQLGDIHFNTGDEQVATQADLIGAAIAAEIDAEITQVLIAVCGDAAFSGRAEQFDVALEFIKSISRRLEIERPSIKTRVLSIPGNHDCDFSGDQAARDALVKQLSSDAPIADSILRIVMQPLSAYFTFSTELSEPGASLDSGSPFHRVVELEDKGLTLRLHLLNTAWMSSLHESPGSLWFPLQTMCIPKNSAAVSIALLHHPINWFAQPYAMRPLRDRLAECADVVLVNHEHVAEATESKPLFAQDTNHSRIVYVAGGVLNDSANPVQRTFNTLRIDLDQRALQITRFEMTSSGGVPYFSRSEAVPVKLPALGVVDQAFALTPSFQDFLNDPGAPVHHPRRDPRHALKLSDVFLYPDLWELDDEHDGSLRKQVRSDMVPNAIKSMTRVLITGGERSGRSSLLKQLFQSLTAAGDVPLVLRGQELPKKREQVRECIRRALQAQYAHLKPDQFEQLERQRKTVLVDDIHFMSVEGASAKVVFEEIELRFGRVILFGSELLKLDSANKLRAAGLWEYRQFVILGFGEVLRERFVRQWIALGSDAMLGPGDLDLEVERLCLVVNSVLRKHLLPPYPLFLIVLLQQADSSKPNIQGGSFGHLFEGVVTVVLGHSKFVQISIGDKYNYLASLAMEMYRGKSLRIAIGAYHKWHSEYWDKIERVRSADCRSAQHTEPALHS